MPNVHLTDQMHRYAQERVDAGACASLSEVVRAGLRLPMERDGARQFHALKGELEAAVQEAEAGGFEKFDPVACEPGVELKQPLRHDDQAVAPGAPRSGRHSALYGRDLDL